MGRTCADPWLPTLGCLARWTGGHGCRPYDPVGHVAATGAAPTIRWDMLRPRVPPLDEPVGLVVVSGAVLTIWWG